MKMRPKNPVQMFDIVWDRLCTKDNGKEPWTVVPEAWKEPLDKLKLYARTMYLLCAYATENAKKEENLLGEVESNKIEFPQDKQDPTDPRCMVWLMGSLWNTEGFSGGDDVGARRSAFIDWAKIPGEGMRRTLGVLYYAMMNTAIRLRDTTN